jgi:outer membrane protein insertion porin family
MQAIITRTLNRIAYLLVAGSLAGFLLTSCSGTKKIPKNDKLYTGAAVTIKSRSGESIEDHRTYEASIQSGIRPIPNAKFLFIFRPRLSIYYMVDSVKKQKGFKHWLKYEVGEAPVLLSSIEPEKTAAIIANNMENQGFFDAHVDYEIHPSGKKASIEYIVTTAEPYVINNVTFPSGSWELYKQVGLTEKNTLLTKGSRYDLDLLKSERSRIDSIMKQAGYFYFSPEYLLFKVDSTSGTRKVDIRVDVKLSLPHEATIPYTIQDIYIYPNYSVVRDSVAPEADTLVMNGYRYITADSMFRPKAILRAVALQPGKAYNRSDHDFTLSRLTELGVFKFVNMQFEELDSDADSGKLACRIYLTPTFKRSMRMELQAVSKSNNYAGPVLTASYRDRNIFKGAELFVLRGNASYEAQFMKNQPAYNAYEVGIDAELYFPRFVSPVHIKKESRLYMPRTQILLGASQVSRIQLFSVNSFKFISGYTWQESQAKRHELNPISINYLQLTQSTQQFEELLQANLQLQNSYREQFTIGGTYSFIYNTQALPGFHHEDYYFNGNINLSGNTVSLIERISGQDFSELFGAPYSQYAKFETDLRYYFRPSKKTRVANRIFAGIGMPYGNSKALPFIEQYFSGGPNSIRAFSARSLGPGSYRPDPDSVSSYIGRAGDIRIEGSTEFRFDIVSIFKGALFIDAGNVWLAHEDPAIPGGKFNPAKFLDDLAIGAGAGLRIDVSFFVLRFDVATPLKTPYKTTVTNNTETRKPIGSNLVLNVALGYPF